MRSFIRSAFLTILSLYLLSFAAALPYVAPSTSVDVGTVDLNSLGKRQVRSADYGSDGGPPGDPSQPSSQNQPSGQPSTESSSNKETRSVQGATALDAIPWPSQDRLVTTKYNPSALQFGKRNARSLKFFKWASDSSNHAGQKRESVRLAPERTEIDVSRNARNGSFSRQPMFLPRYQKRQTSIEPSVYSSSADVKPLRTSQASVPLLDSQDITSGDGTHSLSASSDPDEPAGDCSSCANVDGINVKLPSASPGIYVNRSVSKLLSAATIARDHMMERKDAGLESAVGDIEVNSDDLNAFMKVKKSEYVELGSTPTAVEVSSTDSNY